MTRAYRIWKWVLLPATGLLLAGNLLFAALLADDAHRCVGLEVSLRDVATDFRDVARLLPGRLKRDTVEAWVARERPDALVEATADGLRVDGLGFAFDAAGRLIALTHWSFQPGFAR